MSFKQLVVVIPGLYSRTELNHTQPEIRSTFFRRMLTSSSHTRLSSFIHSFIHSGHFYSAPSSPLLLRGAPDYSTDTASEFHAEAHRQLQVKDLPKVPTWRLERE